MAGTRILMAVTNDLSNDQRVRRHATALQDAGYAVTVIGRIRRGSPVLEQRSYRQVRMWLPAERGPLFYLCYNLVLFFRLLVMPADIFHANDLDTLPAFAIARVFRRKPLVYDAHELFTEVPELTHRPLVQKIWRWLERRCIPAVSHAMTVSYGIQDWYQQQYKLHMKVVRNLPFRKPFPDRSERSRILVYQGALNLGRGIELMIDAMSLLPEYQLYVIGKGDVEAGLKLRAANMANVVFTGHIPPAQLHQITRTAHIGLSLEEGLGLNYEYALPNKVFDYIQAGVPVLVAARPEMAALVQETGTGRILEDAHRTPAALAAAIRALSEPETWKACHQACRKAAETLCFETEQTILLDLYTRAQNT